MCRSLNEGGRRCPCSNPENRSAYRKAIKAARSIEAIGEGGTESPSVTDEAFELSSLLEVWQPDKVTELGEMVSKVARHFRHSEGSEHFQDAKRLESLGGIELVTRVLGESVALEAERRAGVSSKDIHEEKLSLLAEAEDSIAESKKTLEKVTEKIKATPEYLEWQENKKVADDYWLGFDENFDRGHYAEFRARESAKRKELDSTLLSQQARELNEVIRNANNARANPMSEAMKEGLSKLSDSYLEVIGETRLMGGLSGRWHSKTAKKASAAFDEAMQIFPRDWIEAHNSGLPTLARISSKRAHYSNRRNVMSKKRVRAGSLVDMRNEPEPNVWFSYREPTDEERGTSHWNNRLLFREDWKVSTSVEKPRGSGWEFYMDEKRGYGYWRRPEYKMVAVESQTLAEITTNSRNSVVRRSDSPLFQTSTHELSHRFEAVMPEIGRLEMDFLRRRTSNNEGERNQAKALYGGVRHRGKKEMAREDDFADAYMGKDYGSMSHHEVLSMGVEALFSGEVGGLVGAGRYKADLDTRAFVLGLLVSVGRNRKDPSNQS